MPSWGPPKDIEVKIQTTYFYLKSFLKKQRNLELVPLLHFLHDFWREIFVLLYSISWPNVIVWLPSWDIGQYVYSNCFLTRLWCHKFEINLMFQIKPYFLHETIFFWNASPTLRPWILNPGVLCLKSVGGSIVNSAFHPSETINL